MSKPSIFVAIPAYRDAELAMTVDRMILQANNPRQLTFGICQQDVESDWENFNRYKGIIDVRLDNYLPEQSNGLCWALNKCHAKYDGEDYFLQIDSHLEFIEGWDTILMDQYQQFQNVISGPAIMASYPAAYTLNSEGERVLQPTGYVSKTLLYYEPDKNFPQGQALPIGDRNRPIKARYLNGGFMFGHGSFSNKVPYDPNIIFWGTEIVATVRCWTHGFNLYHPCLNVCWHHYGDRLNARKGRPHVWNEEDDSKRAINFHVRNKQAFNIVDKILTGTYESEYGLGTVRTLTDYEKYAGINFKTKERTEECSTGNYEDC